MTDRQSPGVTGGDDVECVQTLPREVTSEDRELVELPNDRVERFYRILLGEWALIRDWHSNAERRAGGDRLAGFRWHPC
jgi:hypothetical protein